MRTCFKADSPMTEKMLIMLSEMSCGETLVTEEIKQDVELCMDASVADLAQVTRRIDVSLVKQLILKITTLTFEYNKTKQ